MKRYRWILALLVLAGLVVVIGYASGLIARKPVGVQVNDGEIQRIIIKDYNWEIGVTTTYTIDPHEIAVVNDSDPPFSEQVVLSLEESERMQALFDGFNEVYPGAYRVEDLADGVIVTFEFYLSDETMVTTSLNNIRIDSYAELTAYVSTLVEPMIHYDQYRMKSLDEIDVSNR